MATVLNKLTMRTKVNSLIGITMRDGSIILHTSAAAPEQLRVDLAPALGRLAVRQHTQAEVAAVPAPALPAAPPAPQPSDHIGRLERLKALHDSGVVNEEQFEKMKAKIIEEMLAS